MSPTDSHWLSGDEAEVGTLTPGRRADLVAVDVDLAAADETALHRAQPVAVMVEGSWVLQP